MVVDVVKNNGYKWSIKDDVYFKGYFTYLDSEIQIYREESAINELKRINTIEELTELLKRIDGAFAFIIKKGETLFAAVDRARSIPLYFSQEAGVVSDHGDSVKAKLGDMANIDEEQYTYLFASGYTLGNETVYSEIKQLDLGEV